MSALHEAISGWNDDQIKWLLDHGANVNERDARGQTPLMLAAEKHLYPEQVHDLIRRGADIHATDASGRTSLMVALDFGSLECLGALLEHFTALHEAASVDADYDNGRLALLFAIYQCDMSAVHRLLDAGADVNARNQWGRTPLMMAIELDRVEVAAALLRRGADVHAREADGNRSTALDIAAYAAHPDCVRVLIEHGAEVDARDGSQWTPLISAAMSSSAAAVRLLLEHGADIHSEGADGQSALSQAGWLADEETIRTLLEWGAGSDVKHLRSAFHACFDENNCDMAPLFIEAGLKIGLAEAVQMDDMDQINRLFAEGVDKREINRGLMTAAGHSSPEIVRMLLKSGADPNIASRGETPLMRAYWNPRYVFENVDVLLKAGADANARDEEGETPFTMLTEWYKGEEERIHLMRKMLKYGADIDAQSNVGTTALMSVARRGEIGLARFLLEHGAEVNLLDQDGRTALIFAVTSGHTAMVRLLLEQGATSTERATDGSTALSIAKRWVGKEIASILLDAGAVE